MGYPQGTNGYLILDIKTEKFVISRNVIFQEEVFPFKQLKENLNGKQNNQIIHTVFDDFIPKSSTIANIQENHINISELDILATYRSNSSN